MLDLLIDSQLIDELTNRKTANINVKKPQFIHMLTATDLRTSKTAKNKKSYFTILLHIDIMEKNKHTRTAHVAAVVFAFTDDLHQLLHNLFT